MSGNGFLVIGYPPRGRSGRISRSGVRVRACVYSDDALGGDNGVSQGACPAFVFLEGCCFSAVGSSTFGKRSQKVQKCQKREGDGGDGGINM